MKYIKQVVYILLFSFIGEVLQTVIPLPIPAAIYGLVLLLIALMSGLLKTEKVVDAANFFISILPLLLVAPAVNILKYWELISPKLAAICIICVASTVLIFAVSGLITKALLNKKGDTDHD